MLNELIMEPKVNILLLFLDKKKKKKKKEQEKEKEKENIEICKICTLSFIFYKRIKIQSKTIL
jgi:hypothetical protein